jgi:hypothetical protein
MQPGLFEAADCDHLPVGQRHFIGDWLICGRCGKKLRINHPQGGK